MRRLLYFALLLVGVSCGNGGGGRQTTEVSRPRVDFLKLADRVCDIADVSEVLAMSRDSIINPHAILSFGDYVVLADSRTWKALTIFNEASGEYDRVLARGNANNEIKFAADLGLVSAEEQRFFLRDKNQSRIFFMGIDEASGRVVLESTTQINRLGAFSEFGYDGGLLVGGVTNSRCRYMVASAKKNRVISRFGEFEGYEFDNDSVHYGTINYPGRMAIDRANNRFAYLSQRGETLEVGSYDDSERNLEERSKRKELSDKERQEMSAEEVAEYDRQIFETADSVVVSRLYNMPRFTTQRKESGFETSLANGFRYAFGSSTASAEYIYTLFDGRSMKQRRRDGDEDDLIWNLCVLDWQGDLQLHITSEYGFKAISYNDARRRLYCLCMTETGEYEIRVVAQDRLFEH